METHVRIALSPSRTVSSVALATRGARLPASMTRSSIVMYLSDVAHPVISDRATVRGARRRNYATPQWANE